ncbi:hypothetical protein [Streptomyces pseudovenezuelae]|uniref:hypothetical protein n=1 Tax=Streptomyces pseudovenezuelae TaxID=67350 RepID=UPI002E80A009|nr:hypothetical protein [Streptomyces pseudovenezuelae]
MVDGRLPTGEGLHCAKNGEALILLPVEEMVENLAQRCLAPRTACHPVWSRCLEEALAVTRWRPVPVQTQTRACGGLLWDG